MICGQSVLDDACEIRRDGGGRDDPYRLSCESAMWTFPSSFGLVPCASTHPSS